MLLLPAQVEAEIHGDGVRLSEGMLQQTERGEPPPPAPGWAAQINEQLHRERVATAPTGQQAGTSAAARIFTSPLSGYNPSRRTWFSPNALWSYVLMPRAQEGCYKIRRCHDQLIKKKTDKSQPSCRTLMKNELGKISVDGNWILFTLFFSPGRRGQEFSALFLLKPVVLRRWSWGLTIARSASV